MMGTLRRLLFASLLTLGCGVWGAPLVNKLPRVLLELPEPVSPTKAPLTGLINGASFLSTRPLAVLGYVSDKNWALLEFLAMTHASWRHLKQRNTKKVDIFAFAHPRWADQLASFCTVVNLDRDFSEYATSSPQCFLVVYPPPPQHIWHDYPFINNVHFFADDRVARILTQNYGYIMKSDFDTFLTPALISHAPQRLLFGIQEYALLSDTQRRLVRVATDLGLKHRGQHNLGPTWLADAATIIDMANRTIPVLHHIITKEFDQLPGGGIAQKWVQGEGFPLWSAGMAAMYATEIVANHFVENFDSTLLMDTHADSSQSVHEVLHIHCRHGDGDFSKFAFFEHHYDDADLSTLDMNIVRDYAMHLAVSTWRMINPLRKQTVRASDEL